MTNRRVDYIAIAPDCRSCKGYGHFKANGEPSIDGRDRKCLDCGGTGKRPIGPIRLGPIPTPIVPAENFLRTIMANVDNQKLSDTAFREFIRNSLPLVIF
jgi:hypothetical protein